MAIIIDGKAVSAATREAIKNEVAELKEKGVTPGLAVIIVGDDPASRVYVNNKKKACEALGIISEEYALPESTTQQELLALIDTLNKNESINGILCQLPLPKHLDEKLIINSIRVIATRPYATAIVECGIARARIRVITPFLTSSRRNIIAPLLYTFSTL